MAGRKPTPTAIKLVKGNPGKRSIEEDDISPDASIPSPPVFLEKEAKGEWNRVAVILFNLGVLSEIDRTALAAYCQAYCRWAQAERKIKKEGMTLETSNGNVVQSPYVGIANTALKIMHKFLVEFGMTPSARSSLKIADKRKTAPEDEFFGNG